MKVQNGNQLSAEKRLTLKRRLLRAGWFQNEHKKWEHPHNRLRVGLQGYTLFGAARKENLI